MVVHASVKCTRVIVRANGDEQLRGLPCVRDTFRRACVLFVSCVTSLPFCHIFWCLFVRVHALLLRLEEGMYLSFTASADLRRPEHGTQKSLGLQKIDATYINRAAVRTCAFAAVVRFVHPENLFNYTLFTKTAVV